MLIAAALVPGPPAFVPELMGSAANELDELRHAADSVVSSAVSDLLAMKHDSPPISSADVQLVIVGPGKPGEYDAGRPVSFGSFGRDVSLAALADGPRTDKDLPTPLMVARYLASRDIASHPEHSDLWATARWVTTSGAGATSLGERLRDDATRIAVILVADGALCHGPKAPRAEDPRADGYDDEVCDVLASGELGRLAQIDADLGDELGASWPQVWPVLFTAAEGYGIGGVLWQGAPYGVGWVVAQWRPVQEVARH